MIRANINEDREATIARVLAGLNWECSRASILCGVGGHGLYGHEGGKAVEAQG